MIGISEVVPLRRQHPMHCQQVDEQAIVVVDAALVSVRSRS
jgi:hypothetical protein